MKVYSIRDWGKIFENNRSRELKSLDWVPIPNNHDGENFSAIMQHPKGAEIFAAWVLIVEVASRCDPRGTLLRGGGKPHNSQSLSLKTRAPEKWFTTAFYFLESNTDWLDVKEVPDETASSCGNPAPNCGNPASGCLEGKGIEVKGNEGKVHCREVQFHADARVLIHTLNELTGARFRESRSNFKFIISRLKEPDVTVEDCRKMIERQTRMWKGTEMEKYLRPETLFNETKFNGYYAARELPLPSGNGKPADHNQGF